jgi:nicotinate phosphoribosyltransferase
MGQLVFHDLPVAMVEYSFINRGDTSFPKEFDKVLNWQIEQMATLKLTDDEANFLNTIPGIRPTYVEWFKNYRYDPGEVVLQQNEGKLSISIKGSWYRTIFWEIPLMALVSELFFKMTGQTPDIETDSRLTKKTENLSNARCQWSDFGTRRRFSYDTQDCVVNHMKFFKGFIGTSNVHLAMKHEIRPIGTSAHEMVMGLSALYGSKMANKMWMKHWSDHFGGLNGIALTDTFTTEVFLRDWDNYFARLFDGVRQDSGDPFAWGKKMLTHYTKLGIDATSKKFVFSDGLNDEVFIRLTKHFRGWAQVIGGIGTFLTNDCGKHITPLNMVIKMTTADFGYGPVDVVKLSDVMNKHTGKLDAIELTKKELKAL